MSYRVLGLVSVLACLPFTPLTPVLNSINSAWAAPLRVSGISRAVAVSAFGDASYALLEDGSVLGWGDKLWRAGGAGIDDAVAVASGATTAAVIRAA
jgi:hypothetical protein